VEARRRHDERGAVALLVAAALVAMFGLAAIVVDLGNARDLVRQAQNAADAGALGAARVMAGPGTPDPAQAVAAGRQYVTANGGDGASATITIDTAAGTVDVRLAPQRAPGFFAGFIGAGTPDVAASAQARWRGQTSLPCALCVLGDYSGQVGTALVVRGSVAVNGALTFASAQGSLSVSPPGSGTIGYFTSYDGGGTVTPPPVKLAAPVADPFRTLPLPPVEANSAVVARPGTGTCAPGVYTDVSNCTAFTGGGVYVLTGAPGMQTISINANAFDSLFYVTCHSVGRPPAREIRYAPCAAGVPPAQLFGAGRADATVTARTSGPYRGFAFVWDRGMVCPTPQCKQSLVGNARLVVEGVVYGPSVTLGAAGNGFWTTRGTVIAGGVSLAGVGVAGVHVEIDAGTAPPVVAVPSGPVQLSR
jgi:Flp pilus assembly protein TadG